MNCKDGYINVEDLVYNPTFFAKKSNILTGKSNIFAKNSVLFSVLNCFFVSFSTGFYDQFKKVLNQKKNQPCGWLFRMKGIQLLRALSLAFISLRASKIVL